MWKSEYFDDDFLRPRILIRIKKNTSLVYNYTKQRTKNSGSKNERVNFVLGFVGEIETNKNSKALKYII